MLVAGRTRPGHITSALSLFLGKPFRWDGNRWNQIATSGVFASILRAAPQPISDGTVQFHLVATEAPTRHWSTEPASRCIQARGRVNLTLSKPICFVAVRKLVSVIATVPKMLNQVCGSALLTTGLG